MASATRFGQTNTGGFDQVTAVSQKMINDQLKTMMNTITDLKTFAPKKTTWGDYECFFKDCLLDPAQCAIPVDQNDFSSVRIYINFSSGQWTAVNNEDEDKPITKDYDVAGWVICFVIRMGLAGVDASKLEDVKKKLNIAGDYSIQRLYLDFTTADIANLQISECKFGQYNFEKDFASDLQDAMKLGVIKWLKKLNVDATDLMYHGTANQSTDLNPIAPTFPPEQVIFQTYPFKDPSGKAVTGKLYDRNSLLYLETCEGNPPTNTLIPWSGNFITNGDDGKSSVNGTMIISRKLFFQKFLLPLLREFNQRTQITPTWAKNDIDGLMIKNSWRYMVGWDPDHTDSKDSYYDFEEDLGNKRFKWEKTKSEQKDNAGSTGFLNSSLKVKGDVQTYLTWSAGSHVLLYTASSHYRVEMTDEQIGIDNDCNIDVKVGYRIKFTFQNVAKGVLKIDTAFPKADGTNDDNTNFADAVWTTGSTHASSIFQKNPDDQQQSIRTALNNQLSSNSWLTTRLLNALKEHRFVFPGNGTFSFSDPAFNGNGDLLVALDYDGLSAPPKTGSVGNAPPVPTATAPTALGSGANFKR